MQAGSRRHGDSIDTPARNARHRAWEGMMTDIDEFGEAMEARSGLRLRRWRILVAHDANAATCDPLIAALEPAFPRVEVTDVSSIDGARAALATSSFDACLVCLDLQPAPLAGVR